MKKISTDPDGLTGKLLIAMPGLSDPRFERSVVFICAHGDEGAIGLIVNKPLKGLMLSGLLTQLEIEPSPNSSNIHVHFGGPVETTRGFALHSQDYKSKQATQPINSEFCLTTTLDVVEALASGSGPEHAILALGYAGWGPGQLEEEIRANGWLTAPSSPSLVYSTDDTTIWQSALKTIGINPATLSADGGRA